MKDFPMFLKSLIPVDTRSWRSEQGLGSLVTLFVAAFLLGLTIFIGFVLVINALDFAGSWLGFLKLDDALNFGHIIILGIAFIVSIAVAIVCVYLFNNQALQKVVRVYAWLCSICAFLVYMRVVWNLNEGVFIFFSRFPRYLVAIAVITTAVYILPLLFNRYDVRMFAMPVFVGNFIHLMAILLRNILPQKPPIDLSPPVIYQAHRITVGLWEKFPNLNNFSLESSRSPHILYFWGDIILFIVMVTIAISFIRNAPYMSRIKRQMDLKFAYED